MIPVNPTIDPTDRSIPPVRITISIPRASRPVVTIWRSRLVRLLSVRNDSLVVAATMTRITNAAAKLALSSNAVPTLGCAMPTRDAKITPASPAQKPLIVYASRTWRWTLMPARRTASALPPIATIARPVVVRVRKTQAIANATSMMIAATGIGPSVSVPSVRNPGFNGVIGVSE